jgi:hypothetical protein
MWYRVLSALSGYPFIKLKKHKPPEECSSDSAVFECPHSHNVGPNYPGATSKQLSHIPFAFFSTNTLGRSTYAESNKLQTQKK